MYNVCYFAIGVILNIGDTKKYKALKLPEFNMSLTGRYAS